MYDVPSLAPHLPRTEIGPPPPTTLVCYWPIYLLLATGPLPTTSRLCYWLLYLLLAHYIPTLLLALLSATGPLHPDSATVPSICYWPHKTQYWLPSALCYCWLSWLHYSGSTPCSLLLAATQIIIEHEKDKI